MSKFLLIKEMEIYTLNIHEQQIEKGNLKEKERESTREMTSEGTFSF